MPLDPRLAVLLAATLWGTTGTARALGPDGASPTAVGAARLVVGGACLVLVGWRVGWLSAPRRADTRGSTPRDGGGAPAFVIAVAAMAVYQPLFFRGAAPEALTARVFGCAGLVLLPAALAAGIGPLLSPGGLLMAAHLGIVTVAVGYVLFTRGLTGVGVAAAGTLTLAEPATATLCGIAILGERPGGAALVGLSLVAAGIVLLVTSRRRGRVVVDSPGP